MGHKSPKFASRGSLWSAINASRRRFRVELQHLFRERQVRLGQMLASDFVRVPVVARDVEQCNICGVQRDAGGYSNKVLQSGILIRDIRDVRHVAHEGEGSASADRGERTAPIEPGAHEPRPESGESAASDGRESVFQRRGLWQSNANVVIVAIGRGHIASIYQYFHAGDDAMSSTSPGIMRCTRRSVCGDITARPSATEDGN